jgi:hypothetical protein
MHWLRSLSGALRAGTALSAAFRSAIDNSATPGMTKRNLKNNYDDYNGSTTIFTFPAYEADGLAFDSQQDAVYVAGFTDETFDSQPSHGLLDGYLTKFTASGERKWSRLIGGKNIDLLVSVTVDPVESAIYACGYTLGSVNGQKNAGKDGKTSDVLVLKMSGEGRQLWLHLYGGPQDDACESLAYDAKRQAVYLAGFTFNPLGGQPYRGEGDALLIRLSSVDGSMVWTRVFGTINEDMLSAISIGPNADEVFVGGIIGGSIDNQPFQGGAMDGLICRFNADGQRLQTVLFGTARSDWIQALEFVSSDTQTLYVGGTTDGSFNGSNHKSERGQFDAFGAKLSYGAKASPPTLTTQWVTQYGGFGFDAVTNIVYQRSTESIYLTGFSTFAVDGNNKGGDGGLLSKRRRRLHRRRGKLTTTKTINKHRSSKQHKRELKAELGDGTEIFDMFLSKIRDKDGHYERTQMFGTSDADYGLDACMDTIRDAVLIVGRFDDESSLLRVNVKKLFNNNADGDNNQPPTKPTAVPQPAQTTAAREPVKPTEAVITLAPPPPTNPTVINPDDNGGPNGNNTGNTQVKSPIWSAILITVLLGAAAAVLYVGVQRYRFGGYRSLTLANGWLQRADEGAIQLE